MFSLHSKVLARLTSNTLQNNITLKLMKIIPIENDPSRNDGAKVFDDLFEESDGFDHVNKLGKIQHIL